MPLLQHQTYSMKSQVLHMSFSPSCLPKNHDILKKFGVFRFGLYCIVLPSRSQGDLFKCSILNACSGVVQNRRKVCNLSWHCRIMFAQKLFQGQIWGRWLPWNFHKLARSRHQGQRLKMLATSQKLLWLPDCRSSVLGAPLARNITFFASVHDIWGRNRYRTHEQINQTSTRPLETTWQMYAARQSVATMCCEDAQIANQLNQDWCTSQVNFVLCTCMICVVWFIPDSAWPCWGRSCEKTTWL